VSETFSIFVILYSVFFGIIDIDIVIGFLNIGYRFFRIPTQD